jgi:hypothetical protein
MWRGAASQETPPKGFPAGPWILAPTVVAGYEHNTNVFLEDEIEDPTSDYSLVVEPEITATLPFRNSYLDFHYKATWRDYGSAFPDEKLAQELGVRLSLLFASMDRITIGGNRIFGVAATEEFDPGGEVVYDGKEFDLTDYSVELKREVQGRRGYRIQVRRSELDFDPAPDLRFFDFKGWSGEAEYREPLNENLWIIGAYSGSRTDHFCKNLDPLGNPCPPPSEPLRKESTDTASLGLRGVLAANQPFYLRVGSASYRYTLRTGSNFQGVTAEGSLGIPIGGGTSLRFGLSRRPYPSFYFNSNFYLVERVDTQLQHDWRNGAASAGLRAFFSRSRYSNAIDFPGFPQDGTVRRDTILRGELYANVFLVKRFGLSTVVSWQSRDSNIEGEDYEGESYFLGLTYGP